MAKKLLIVGAGPKALAIAARAAALKKNQFQFPEITIIEQNEVGAHWTGKYGYTDGSHLLGTPAEKDVGFPYSSDKPAVDSNLMEDFSWLAFNVSRRSTQSGELARYNEDIDRGMRWHPAHSRWAEYLRWVAGQAGAAVKFVPGRVDPDSISAEGKRWRVEVIEGNKRRTPLEGDGLVITGTGPAKKMPGQPLQHSSVFDGKTVWQHLSAFADLPWDDEPIGIIGSGETAASVVVAFARTLREPVPIVVVNRQGAIFSRGEGYWENHVYTDPEAIDWTLLPLAEREEIIGRTDRGVFSQSAMADINHLYNVIHKRMDVAGIEIQTKNESDSQGRPVIVDGSGMRLPVQRLIVATGFDPWWFVRLFKDEKLRALMHEKHQPTLTREIVRDLSFPPELLPGPKLHVPMLAGLAQGPGFPNLSCLGRVADRILASY
jgi:mycobactin lysine-N-oxygenase